MICNQLTSIDHFTSIENHSLRKSDFNIIFQFVQLANTIIFLLYLCKILTYNNLIAPTLHYFHINII